MYFLDKVIDSSVEGVNNAVHVLYSLRFLYLCSLKIAYFLHFENSSSNISSWYTDLLLVGASCSSEVVGVEIVILCCNPTVSAVNEC